MFWMKIVLPVVLALGILGGIYLHFKHDRENEKLIGSQAERIAQLESNLAERDKEVTDLNQRIRERNQRALDEIAQAEAAQAAAQAEAEKARADKKRSEVKRAEAQRRYREALDADEKVQMYSNAAIPDAVLERLRSANGETGDDSVRAGSDPYSDLQTASGRVAAWLQMPFNSSERESQRGFDNMGRVLCFSSETVRSEHRAHSRSATVALSCADRG